MSYARLTPSEREEIAIGRAAHRTCAEIGADLGRNASTIRRELHRGGGWSAYRALASQYSPVKARSVPCSRVT